MGEAVTGQASVTEQESEQEAVVAGEAVGEACLASNLTRMRHSASESGSCTCLNKLSSDRRPPATASARWTPSHNNFISVDGHVIDGWAVGVIKPSWRRLARNEFYYYRRSTDGLAVGTQRQFSPRFTHKFTDGSITYTDGLAVGTHRAPKPSVIAVGTWVQCSSGKSLALMKHFYTYPFLRISD
ncbi:hypothetical protein PIB30_082102 [Stylosanthes scabra]|uniref:Uncharacterized protein n=1 Tax=Stylosanthes scabra TaxID=79078 RepID=A0ABU6YQX3_9FABA|nr:hypothetical protein [Stylosanthes scabra]